MTITRAERTMGRIVRDKMASKQRSGGESERSVSICGPITEASATQCIAQLLFLSKNNSTLPITLQIDSPGGHVSASIAIIRMINDLQCPISTYCIHQAGGTAAAIAAHGTHGVRAASPAAVFGFARTFVEGSRGYVEAEISQFDQALIELLAEDTGKHQQEVCSLFQTEQTLTASEAIAFGLIDSICELPTMKTERSEGWIGSVRRALSFQ